MSSQTDNTSLIWKALNALTKTSFSNEHTIPNTFTAEVFRKHFLSLAETLTRTFRQDGGEYQCSEGLQNFCINRLKSHDAFSISEITVYKVGNYISSVGSRNTSGCDWNSNRMNLVSLPYLVQHLTYVYNLCFKRSCLPSDLKPPNSSSSSQLFNKYQ